VKIKPVEHIYSDGTKESIDFYLTVRTNGTSLAFEICKPSEDDELPVAVAQLHANELATLRLYLNDPSVFGGHALYYALATNADIRAYRETGELPVGYK
jgi:hypothetical protein